MELFPVPLRTVFIRVERGPKGLLYWGYDHGRINYRRKGCASLEAVTQQASREHHGKHVMIVP